MVLILFFRLWQQQYRVLPLLRRKVHRCKRTWVKIIDPRPHRNSTQFYQQASERLVTDFLQLLARKHSRCSHSHLRMLHESDWWPKGPVPVTYSPLSQSIMVQKLLPLQAKESALTTPSKLCRPSHLPEKWKSTGCQIHIGSAWRATKRKHVGLFRWEERGYWILA